MNADEAKVGAIVARLIVARNESAECMFQLQTIHSRIDDAIKAGRCSITIPYNEANAMAISSLVVAGFSIQSKRPIAFSLSSDAAGLHTIAWDDAQVGCGDPCRSVVQLPPSPRLKR